jgi:undecaprenyl diphosphate synthase
VYAQKINKAIPFELQTVPQHVAIIMDGNGRWAREKRLPRVEGHRMGAKSVRTIVEESKRLGVKYLTLFAFSTENWQRPVAEVSALMRLFRQYLISERDILIRNGIRLRAIGRRDKLTRATRSVLEELEAATSHLEGMELILALSYGGRDEIVYAAQQIAMQVAEGTLGPDEIDENCIRKSLFAPDVPDPDLLIRTSSEFRISNFLLWQIAYTEIVVSPLLWPAFNAEAYHECLIEFSRRTRRFGQTSEQIMALRANAG